MAVVGDHASIDTLAIPKIVGNTLKSCDTNSTGCAGNVALRGGKSTCSQWCNFSAATGDVLEDLSVLDSIEESNLHGNSVASDGTASSASW